MYICKSIIAYIIVLPVVICQDGDDVITSATLIQDRRKSNEFSYAGKKYYFELSFTGNYFKALQSCTKRNMQLLTINSPAENDRLRRFIEDLGMREVKIWTSGTDLVGNPAGTMEWVWLSSGDEFTYKNWVPGEPNYRFMEHCVEVYVSGGDLLWNNAICGGEHYFICESSNVSRNSSVYIR